MKMTFDEKNKIHGFICSNGSIKKVLVIGTRNFNYANKRFNDIFNCPIVEFEKIEMTEFEIKNSKIKIMAIIK